ncbi:hypothetical protein F4824DRAFT_455205 [Ustulina deusta]|nr:hypothetical protein F4824DRAFT_455205 [Ustulina deusta]
MARDDRLGNIQIGDKKVVASNHKMTPVNITVNLCFLRSRPCDQAGMVRSSTRAKTTYRGVIITAFGMLHSLGQLLADMLEYIGIHSLHMLTIVPSIPLGLAWEVLAQKLPIAVYRRHYVCTMVPDWPSSVAYGARTESP